MTNRDNERGAVLIIVALCITAIFLFLALVIDLGATRSDRRNGQVAVDNAIASSTRTLAETDDVVQACETAFDYLALNLGVTLTGPACSASLTVLSDSCTASTLEQTVPRATADGVFQATFVYPVTNLSPLMNVSTIGSGGPTASDADDGPSCERVGMRVSTTGSAYFGGIAGSGERQSAVSAVGRADAGNKILQALNLLALERHDCDTITVGSNNTELIVASPEDNPITPEDESLLPGIVASDSDARDCGGQNDTIEVNGNGAQILAQGPCPNPPGGNTCGQIDVFSTLVDPTCSASTDASQFACDEGQGTITPDASSLSEQYTRAPVDHRYNCKPATDPGPLTPVASYDDEPWWTALEQDIDTCEDATSTTDYVDELKQYATTTATTAFARIFGGACNANTGVYPVGNYYVDCNTFSVNGGQTVTFAGGNVVFKNNVRVQNNSVLEVHACVRTNESTCPGTLSWTSGSDFVESQASARAAWAYVGGDVIVNGSGTLRLNRTALFLGGTDSDIAQSGTIISSAPEASVGLPDSAGPFDDLALWSEGDDPHTFRGGGANDFQGLYFGGRAHFAMSGGTTVDLRSAQFVSNTIGFNGGVVFTMSPTSDRSVLFEVEASYSLIR
jgi:hypothetical protein